VSAPLQPQAVPGAVPSPQAELEEEAELSRMREEVMSLAADAMAEGMEHCANFEQYAELWLEGPKEFLQHFFTFHHKPVAYATCFLGYRNGAAILCFS